MAAGQGFERGRLLVVAFEGWNDAGEAASSAVRLARDQLGLNELYSVDPEEYFDYQFNRPAIGVDSAGDRRLTWPGVTFYGPRDEPLDGVLEGSEGFTGDIYALTGVEPSRRWMQFAEELMTVIEETGITGIVFLGAMLADVPHTRPIAVHASSENPAVRHELDLERSTYEGPVGILSVLAEAAESRNIPTVSVWASVPHYVHNAPSPKATLALLDKLDDLVGVNIPRADLAEDAVVWETGIDALAGEDDEMASYIEQLEQARDTVDSPEASGEAIAQEFEKYLRRRGDRPDDPRRGPE